MVQDYDDFDDNTGDVHTDLKAANTHQSTTGKSGTATSSSTKATSTSKAATVEGNIHIRSILFHPIGIILTSLLNDWPLNDMKRLVLPPGYEYETIQSNFLNKFNNSDFENYRNFLTYAP